jgi:hypothetical protein
MMQPAAAVNSRAIERRDSPASSPSSAVMSESVDAATVEEVEVEEMDEEVAGGADVVVATVDAVVVGYTQGKATYAKPKISWLL